MHRLSGIVVTAALIAAVTSTTRAAAASPRDADRGEPGTPHSGTRQSQTLDNIAHRGASAHAPENTLAACALARAQGADTCEFDVQQTRDHQLVLMHDPTLARTTDAEKVFPGRSPWNVADFTLAEIRRLDAGSWFSRRYRGERVPTLTEALRMAGRTGAGLLLEIKHPPHSPDIDRRVAAELRDGRFWWQDRRLAVQAFDWRSMRMLHAAVPDVPIVLLGKPDLARLAELARYAGRINLPRAGLTARYVKRVHDHAMQVYTWTTNRRALIRRLISYGVDGIMTERPDRLHELKREIGRQRGPGRPGR